MATRPLAEYESLIYPLPSPPLDSPRALAFPPSSSNRDQFPFTPPPSLPTSSPGSPEYRNKELQSLTGGGGLHSCKMTPISTLSTSKNRPKSSSKKGDRAGSSFTDHVEVSSLPEGYGDSAAGPILPKTRISFPSVFSDEDSVEESLGATRPRRKVEKEPRRRVVSQETVITTSTTRKLERRKVRYSASILDEMEDELVNAIDSRKSRESRKDRVGSPSRGSSTQAGSSPNASRSSRSRLRSLATPHRTSSHQRQTSSPQPSSSSSHATRTSSRSRRRKSSSASKPFLPSKAMVLRSNRPLAPDPSFIYDADDGDDEEHPNDYPFYASPVFVDSSIPLFRPVVNLFTFLLVSTFCCMTVSAVLVASFSLTFCDDFGRRIRAGRRSIEGGIGGVRNGMGRVLGNAKGAIEYAVGGSTSKRTAMPTVTKQGRSRNCSEEEEEEEDHFGSGKPDGEGETLTANANSKNRSSTSMAPRTQGWRYRTSQELSSNPRRRGFNPLSAFTSTRPATPDPTLASDSKSGWATDEDALPFEVPHPTPRASRPASPLRSPRSRQQSSESAQSSSSSSALPPRPHLAVLLPSLFLAVILTLAKLGYSFYKASRERKQREEEEAERRRRQGRSPYSSTSYPY